MKKMILFPIFPSQDKSQVYKLVAFLTLFYIMKDIRGYLLSIISSDFKSL